MARYRFEIQVLRTALDEGASEASEGASTVLMDRCTLDADALPEAAAEYAKLFAQGAVQAVMEGAVVGAPAMDRAVS